MTSLDAGVALGAPGVYVAPETPLRGPIDEPMDVAAFIGIAPRGPAQEQVEDPTAQDDGSTHVRAVPVTVNSWDEYQEVFGGFAGPGLLPYAVSTYFAQGGRRAVVVRAVAEGDPGRPRGSAPAGCATHHLRGGAWVLRARNEGTWGDRLSVRVSFSARPLAVVSHREKAIVLEPGSAVPAGTLLRLRGPAASDRCALFAVVTRLRREGRADDSGSDLVAHLDRATGPAGPVERVEAELTVVDADPERPRRERFVGLGVQPAHPRYLLGVLRRESRLLAPLERTTSDPDPGFVPDAILSPLTSEPVAPAGEDRWHLVTADDLLGDRPSLVRDPAVGLAALGTTSEATSVLVPDLFAPVSSAPHLPSVHEPGDPDFRPCGTGARRTETCTPRPVSLPGLVLRADEPGYLAEVVGRQARLVAAAEAQELVALLDVPPGLRRPDVLRWCGAFASSSAVAVHPWLQVLGAAQDTRPVDLPPSSVVAGLIARTELRRGISRGPANESAAGVVGVAEELDDAWHAELHRLGINVFRPAPGGVFLTSARTLSADLVLRQLTARRLLQLVRRTVRRQIAWSVFEPDGDVLRVGLRRHLEHLLGDLSAVGAFAGRTSAESWFVRISEPGAAGPAQVVVEVGVAPSAPLEFIVVRASLDTTGTAEPSLTESVTRHG